MARTVGSVYEESVVAYLALPPGLFPVVQGYLAEAARFQGRGGTLLRKGETHCESACTWTR